MIHHKKHIWIGCIHIHVLWKYKPLCLFSKKILCNKFSDNLFLHLFSMSEHCRVSRGNVGLSSLVQHIPAVEDGQDIGWVIMLQLGISCQSRLLVCRRKRICSQFMQYSNSFSLIYLLLGPTDFSWNKLFCLANSSLLTSLLLHWVLRSPLFLHHLPALCCATFFLVASWCCCPAPLTASDKSAHISLCRNKKMKHQRNSETFCLFVCFSFSIILYII